MIVVLRNGDDEDEEKVSEIEKKDIFGQKIRDISLSVIFLCRGKNISTTVSI